MTGKPEYIDHDNTLEIFAASLYKIDRAGPGVLRLTFVDETRLGQVVRPVVHVLIPAASVEGMRMKLALGAACGMDDVAAAADPDHSTAH